MAAPLLAVDTPSLLFRAFYALPKTITDGEDRPVNALLGATNLMLNVVEAERPRAVVLCFGPDAAEYRVAAYPGYHADRPEVPEELAPQFADAPAFFAAFGWTSEIHETLEADDLLGSLAAAESERGGEALLLTGDRDMYQCATDRVTVLYVKTGQSGPERMGPEEVRERYGVSPEQVPDFIALRGDPSDGLPGAKGIGEKTAADLLRRHGTLEATLAAAPRERPPRVSGALLDGREILPLFKEIATLRREPVDLPPDTPTDLAGGAAMARSRGMNRLAERLEKAVPA